MLHPRHRSFATSLLLTGLLVVLLSLGGGWGLAYGQTAGPTPTPNQAVLGVTKEADNTTPNPGETVVFIIRVTNNGSTPARNVEIVDPMPSAFEIASVYTTLGTATTGAGSVTVTIPQLDPGVTAVITIETRVRADAQGAVTNEVVVRGIDINGVVAGEARAQAVLDVEGEYVDDSAAQNNGSGTGTGNAGVGGADGSNGTTPSQLSNTGADAGLQWPLLLIGMAMMSAGVAIFVRTRRTS